jgi:hypothetical protein
MEKTREQQLQELKETLLVAYSQAKRLDDGGLKMQHIAWVLYTLADEVAGIKKAPSRSQGRAGE